MSIEAIVNEFSAVAANPKGQLKAYKDAGKKCIGVMPYYAPEELVYAAGMMPFGMWGSNNKTEQRSKEYCATFYCTIAQLDLEMLLDGTMDLLDGVITPTICDTLRPMSQNIRVAMSEKLPCIFLAHPQNRFADWGKQFCLDQYNNVKAGLEKIAGHEIKSEDIAAAIKVYNKSRAARREFVKLASDHCDVIDPIMRSAVLKAAWFMDKAEYTEKLEALNAELKALPAAKWNGVKVVTSGAGAAAISDEAYFADVTAKVIAERTHTTDELRRRGFTVFDSATNFLFTTTDRMPCVEIFEKLRARGILIRHFNAPRISDYLRITIGTPEQMQRFFAALDEILGE